MPLLPWLVLFRRVDTRDSSLRLFDRFRSEFLFLIEGLSRERPASRSVLVLLRILVGIGFPIDLSILSGVDSRDRRPEDRPAACCLESDRRDREVDRLCLDPASRSPTLRTLVRRDLLLPVSDGLFDPGLRTEFSCTGLFDTLLLLMELSFAGLLDPLLRRLLED